MSEAYNNLNNDNNFPDFPDFPDFHFIALGGVGQSALAKILLRLGYKVSGSDIENSKYVELTKKMGAKVYIGHDKNNIQGHPKIVVSSAIKENNPELIRAKELNLDIIHRSDCLKIISEKFADFIGFSGTHGKTTTSGLMSFILDRMGKNPSYAIGGIIPTLEINAEASKDSKYFVAELDESDGTIAKYCPKHFIINNLEPDHLDFYKNGLDDIIKTFEKTASNMALKNDNDAKIFLNLDDSGSREFLSQTCFDKEKIVTFALNNDNAIYRAKNIKIENLKSSFDVYKKDELLGSINLIIPGVHNVYNALSVISVLDILGFEFSSYSKYFGDFKGMKRRFQFKYVTKNIKIIDDYAHHPNEIISTINALKDVKQRKVIIFQPHRYTRLKALWDEFLACFKNIDFLYVVDVFCAGDKFDNQYNSKNFADAIKKTGLSAKYIEGTIMEAGKTIAPELKENDVVITLGAGDITEMGEVINDMLSNKN